jgi:soluble lytic murein transglycosylase-like protein
MRALGMIIGVALLGAKPACAQERVVARSAVTASVDAFGTVTPIQPSRSQVEVVDTPSQGKPLCVGASAMPADEARALVERIATEENFYPAFVLSVAKIESRYASTTQSDKGAYGLMQLMPATAQRYGVDLCQPADNVRGGVRYLRFLHDRYRNPFFILAAYNAGEEALEKNHGVPPYPETVRFVSEVINDFYAWPLPSNGGRASPAGTAQVGAGASDTRDAGVPASRGAKPESNAAAQWSGGFVMHVQ